jgi:hypothetical protein
MNDRAPRPTDEPPDTAHADANSRPAGPAPTPAGSTRDRTWDPPTIVYARAGDTAVDTTQRGVPTAQDEATRPITTSLGVEDATIRRPDKPPEREDRTLKMPERSPPAKDDDATTVQAEPKRAPFDTRVEAPEPAAGLKAAISQLLKRHGKKLWWLHTVYALSLGAFVVTFAQKGFGHARWLAISVSVAWLVVLLFFRLFGTGARQDYVTAWRGARLRFMVMTYVLKNLYQGMLFFLLPFYWKSAGEGAPNRWFVALLGACAVLSTLDLVFDRVLMRWKTLASIFYGVTLFACLNLVIPALFPHTRTLFTLLSAAAISVLGFSTLHVPLSALFRRRAAVLLPVALAAGVGLAYATRALIPPVPMHLASAAVGPAVLPDGRLAMEVKSLHTSVVQRLLAVTDVAMPSGEGDRLQHVWRKDGEEVYRAPQDTTRAVGPAGTLRLQSQLDGKHLPSRLAGRWTLDVETEDGQLVGRTSFEVTE